MFATWKTNGGPMQVSDRPITQRACNNCRTKKVSRSFGVVGVVAQFGQLGYTEYLN